MIFAMFWENPAVVGLILAIPATALGYLGYRRSSRMDEVTKQAGLASSQSVSIGQAVDGLNRVIAALQDDNKVLRADVIALRQNVERIQARLDSVEAGSVDLRATIREQAREITVLHSENEALKAENLELKARIEDLEKINGP